MSLQALGECKVKVNAVPSHAKQAQRGVTGAVLPILNLGA
jgi:hypothetical protein